MPIPFLYLRFPFHSYSRFPFHSYLVSILFLYTFHSILTWFPFHSYLRISFYYTWGFHSILTWGFHSILTRGFILFLYLRFPSCFYILFHSILTWDFHSAFSFHSYLVSILTRGFHSVIPFLLEVSRFWSFHTTIIECVHCTCANGIETSH